MALSDELLTAWIAAGTLPDTARDGVRDLITALNNSREDLARISDDLHYKMKDLKEEKEDIATHYRILGERFDAVTKERDAATANVKMLADCFAAFTK